MSAFVWVQLIRLGKDVLESGFARLFFLLRIGLRQGLQLKIRVAGKVGSHSKQITRLFRNFSNMVDGVFPIPKTFVILKIVLKSPTKQ